MNIINIKRTLFILIFCSFGVAYFSFDIYAYKELGLDLNSFIIGLGFLIPFGTGCFHVICRQLYTKTSEAILIFAKDIETSVLGVLNEARTDILNTIKHNEINMMQRIKINNQELEENIVKKITEIVNNEKI